MHAQGTNIVVGGIAATVRRALARARSLPDGQRQTGVRATQTPHFNSSQFRIFIYYNTKRWHTESEQGN